MGEPDFGDAAAGRAGHDAFVVVQLEMVAHLGQMVGLFLYKAVHGVGVDVFILGQVQRLVKVVHAGRAGHEPAAVRLLAEVLSGLVVFVPDLAHKLFQNVLEGDDALGAAVFVHDDCHVMVLLPQGAQQLGDLGGAGGVEGGGDEVFHRDGLFQTGDVEIFLVDDADDVVHGVVIDGQAGIAGFCEGLRKLFQRNIVLHGHHVYAGRQDLLHLHVVELDGAADELAFPVGKLTVVLSLAHHGDELTFGDGVALAAVDEVSQQLLPLAEQPGQRGEEGQEQTQRRRYGGCNRLGHLLGEGLGGHFAEDEDDYRQHDGGGGGAPLCTQPLGKEDGADGSGGDIHDVVADEDGGEKLVVLLGHRQHSGGGSVALLSAAFQAYLVQGRKCGLGGGEECGKRDQNDQRHQERYTAIVHNKG